MRVSTKIEFKQPVEYLSAAAEEEVIEKIEKKFFSKPKPTVREGTKFEKILNMISFTGTNTSDLVVINKDLTKSHLNTILMALKRKDLIENSMRGVWRRKKV